jgi:hypothetical protein
MVLDSTLVSAVGFSAVLVMMRLISGRIFAKLDDLARGIGAGLVLDNQLLKLAQDSTQQVAATTPIQISDITRSIVSIEHGQVKHRFEGTDPTYPFTLWKELETGVPGQHWLLQDGSVLGYLEF